MTAPAYERDPRLTRLETEVVGGGETYGRAFVVLADTILYPEGGGQPADHGTVSDVPVTDVRRGPDGIRHLLAGPPPTGRVTVVLDWPRRFDHMQQHTAQHLLTAVAEARFGWHTTSFHLGERTSDIELDTPAITPQERAELEEAVAREIRAARPVRARRVSAAAYAAMDVRSRGLPEGHEGDVRLVEITGIDVSTCGGTHCASTAELEAVKLLDTESIRGGTRLSWVAGSRVRGLLGEHHERTARLRDLLGASDHEIPGRVEQKLHRLRAAERELRAMEEDLATATARTLAGGPGPVLSLHEPSRGVPFLQRVARTAAGLSPDRVLFLTAGEADAAVFVVAAGEDAAIDLPAAGRRVAELLEGRGGGSGGMFQGKAGRLSRRDEALALLRGLMA